MSYWTFALRRCAPAPRPLGITAEEDICQDCSEMDFEQIFSDANISYDTILREWEFQDSTGLDKFKNSPCLLCRIFAVGMEEPVEGRRYSLRKYTGQRPPEFLLADQSCSLLGIQYDEWPASLFLGKSIPAFSESKIEEAAVRIIQESLIDYDLIKRWIQSCQSGHGIEKLGPCSPRPRKPIQSLKVIDCLTQTIELSSETSPYVALSYVWGLPTAQNPNPRTGHTSNTIPDLPRTVADAIQATLALGYQYLWVDRYCIDQNDDDDKALHIGQMDLIY